MAGIASEEAGVGRSMEGISSGQRCQSGEALAEWRSSEQVENGTPSTSPPYWDTDDDDDGGPKPSELYGKYTWKIDKFSQINKRELRSNAFEVGGYKCFCAFWLGKDQNTRRDMSREKMDAILKVVVKHFFIEKEVTSTLVMDSLYSGLKALEGQTKSKKGRVKSTDGEEMPAPIIRVEKDMFVLVDDVLILLERAAMEPLPPKDEKGPQNRMKDGNSGEDFNKDSIERDERRLTELGRRTVEIFVLAHIFNHKIEVAYHEAVAFKRQEELIREEGEQKAKRGASEKEKKSKKKQSKQKRNNRKGKDKVREEIPGLITPQNHQEVQANYQKKDFTVDEELSVVEKPDVHEDVSDATDSVDGISEIVQPDSEDRDASPVNWDTDTSEVQPPTEASSSGISGFSSVPNGTSEKRSTSAMDDSSSTCSSDSVPPVVINGSYKGTPYSNCQHEKSPSRGKNRRCKTACDAHWTTEGNQTSELASDSADLHDMASRKATEPRFEAIVALEDRVTRLEQNLVQMKDGDVSMQKKLHNKDHSDAERSSKEKTAVVSSPRSPPRSPPKSPDTTVRLKSEINGSATVDSVQAKKPSSSLPQPADKAATSTTSQHLGLSKPESQNATAKVAEKPLLQQVPVMSRPSSAPLVPGPRPTAPVVSMVQTSPLLARSISAAGRLGPDPSSATHSFVPQSYRNAIVGNSVGSSTSGFAHTSSASLGVNLSPVNMQTPSLASAPLFLTPSSDRVDPNTVQSSFPFGLVARDVMQNGPHWMENSQRDTGRSIHNEPSSLINGIQKLDLYKPGHGGPPEHFTSEFAACTSGRQSQVGVADEFPHLDIINDLLDDESGVGKAVGGGSTFQSLSNGHHLLNRQYTFPCDGVPNDMASSTSSSCRIERMRSYHDGFQRGYVSSSTQFDALREFVPQPSPLPYANGHMDGLMPNQWHMSSSDLSFLGLRNADDGSQYFNPEYSNLACGVNGYTVYRPSNGH
ncbi:hypothetical protein Tsubulata_034546 [Turnera subulata]|uniref:MATH domain-containing protein n=1 Tax=Turnera subulata TaxID=218843 RepID=A0A9Q0J8V3_9ROSI|nr:hypothetical protein Tsubulata_034546 [Turnera subulata]